MVLIIWTTTNQRALMKREEADFHFGAEWVEDALAGCVEGVWAERQ
jgi:hypothetical protein